MGYDCEYELKSKSELTTSCSKKWWTP